MQRIPNSSIFDKAHSPYLQGVAIVAMALLFMIGSKILAAVGLVTLPEAFSWTIAASFILFFTVFNCVFSLLSKDIDKYWKESVIAFLGLTVLTGGLAFLFAGVSLEQVLPYRWLFVVFLFCYLVFISILGFVKRIVDFAENEEWQKPRRTLKKRR